MNQTVRTGSRLRCAAGRWRGHHRALLPCGLPAARAGRLAPSRLGGCLPVPQALRPVASPPAADVLSSHPLAQLPALAAYVRQTSPPRLTRSCRYSVPHIVRGLPPTPAQAQKKSFARYRSLIRGLPPTPAQAHQESLVRAAIASLTSFVGSRPHPHKRRRSHSLATARSFVGYRPHPHKPTKNHSFVPL